MQSLGCADRPGLKGGYSRYMYGGPSGPKARTVRSAIEHNVNINGQTSDPLWRIADGPPPRPGQSARP